MVYPGHFSSLFCQIENIGHTDANEARVESGHLNLFSGTSLFVDCDHLFTQCTLERVMVDIYSLDVPISQVSYGFY